MISSLLPTPAKELQLSQKPKTQRQLRVIAGQWRSRVIDFPEVEAIRPTPDRVRETLFNWLRYDISAARCLELYAGSGVLSIEALSRGAAHITVIDQANQATTSIRNNLKMLGADSDKFELVTADAIPWLQKNADKSWDLIFLDPPFANDDLFQLLSLINDAQCLTPDGYVYFESGRVIESAQLPAGWALHKSKKSGAVFYALCHQFDDQCHNQ